MARLDNQWSKLKSVLIFWMFESSSFPNGPKVFHHLRSFMPKIEAEYQSQFRWKIWFFEYLEFGKVDHVETLMSVIGP